MWLDSGQEGRRQEAREGLKIVEQRRLKKETRGWGGTDFEEYMLRRSKTRPMMLGEGRGKRPEAEGG